MVCSKCGNELGDGVVFCPSCGTPTSGGQNPNVNPYADPADHTAEFDAQDISDNKVFAMLPYIMSVVGIIIALLASSESKYTRFHVRQALKLDVANTLLGVLAVLLFWTCIAPPIIGIVIAVLFVIRIICFIQVCQGKAKEPAIIKDLKIFK